MIYFKMMINNIYSYFNYIIKQIFINNISKTSLILLIYILIRLTGYIQN